MKIPVIGAGRAGPYRAIRLFVAAYEALRQPALAGST